MKNILVPCDFSKPAEEAFKFAVRIAGKSSGTIHVLYVIDITFLRGNPTLSHAYAFNANFLKDIERDADQRFQVMCGRHAPLKIKVQFRHVISSLTFEIERYIQANNIDMVIMGTHGEGNAAFGSNTEKIVRNSPIPVLAVRTAPADIKSIVLPVLPHYIDERFTKEVKHLQSFFNSQLHLLYVNTPLFFKNDTESISELKQFAGDQNFTNFSISVRSDYTLEEGIAHFAKEINADMIAMGTHAWKGLVRLFIGSTTEDIVNHVKLPVWTQCLQ